MIFGHRSAKFLMASLAQREREAISLPLAQTSSPAVLVYRCVHASQPGDDEPVLKAWHAGSCSPLLANYSQRAWGARRRRSKTLALSGNRDRRGRDVAFERLKPPGFQSLTYAPPPAMALQVSQKRFRVFVCKSAFSVQVLDFFQTFAAARAISQPKNVENVSVGGNGSFFARWEVTFRGAGGRGGWFRGGFSTSGLSLCSSAGWCLKAREGVFS